MFEKDVQSRLRSRATRQSPEASHVATSLTHSYKRRYYCINCNLPECYVQRKTDLAAASWVALSAEKWPNGWSMAEVPSAAIRIIGS
jgi:hypothetical protein